MKPGQYVHYGLKNCLIKEVEGISSTLLNLQLATDGLPLFKSKSCELWPILGFISGVSKFPFVIGIYCGSKKPQDVSNFLEQLVADCEEIIADGLHTENAVFPVTINSFIADAPAKAFIKCVKGHSSYNGCDKCEIVGSYSHNRVHFGETSDRHPLRTNESFRSQSNEDHHHNISPLEQIRSLDMVKAFPCEYMHLVCLGVVRKLINLWLKGKPGPYKLQYRKIDVISEHLSQIKQSTVQEFARKPRPIIEVDRYKATEFRQFLLYSGPIVLKNVLDDDYYNHFIVLSVAIRILASPKYYKSSNVYAKELLFYFVEQFKLLYGKEYVSYNVHCLTHLADDAANLGPLDVFSAFKFENHLFKLKKLMKTPNSPLQQLIRRLSEQLPPDNRQKTSMITLNNRKSSKQDLLFGDTVIKNGLSKDSYVLLKNKNLAHIINFTKSSSTEEISVFAYIYKKPVPFFIFPCDSTMLGISVFEKDEIMETFSVEDIECKCQVYAVQDNMVVSFPLLHCHY